MSFEITEGMIPSAQKIVIYGPEGVGKSTFASGFPNALFIDTEGSTKNLPVRRLPTPTSWQMLLEEIDHVKTHPNICDTLVIDTFDWAEQLCVKAICEKSQKSGIEDFGYGKGYIYEKEEIARFLHSLNDVTDLGIHVVLTAHAQLRKIEQPEEFGSYDHWEMKLGQKTGSVISPLVKEWADMVLFAKFETIVVAADDTGKKHKAQGGRRRMYTAHTPWWDAKNRVGLPEEADFLYGVLDPFLIPRSRLGKETGERYMLERKAAQIAEADKCRMLEEILEEAAPDAETPPAAPTPAAAPPDDIPKALRDLMTADGITEDEIRLAVSNQGIYPADCPISQYDDHTMNGLIIGEWTGLKTYIYSLRKEMPFK